MRPRNVAWSRVTLAASIRPYDAAVIEDGSAPNSAATARACSSVGIDDGDELGGTVARIVISVLKPPETASSYNGDGGSVMTWSYSAATLSLNQTNDALHLPYDAILRLGRKVRMHRQAHHAARQAIGPAQPGAFGGTRGKRAAREWG